MFNQLGVVDPLPNKAPVPDDLAIRTKDVKGAAYFLDAAQVGICNLVENAWYEGSSASKHTHAIVIVVRPGRTPEVDNIAYEWASGHEIAAAELRAIEIAVAVSEHIQWMGFEAKAHDHQLTII